MHPPSALDIIAYKDDHCLYYAVVTESSFDYLKLCDTYISNESGTLCHDWDCSWPFPAEGEFIYLGIVSSLPSADTFISTYPEYFL